MKSYIELKRECYAVETPVVGRVRLQLSNYVEICEIELNLYEILQFHTQANRHTEKPFQVVKTLYGPEIADNAPIWPAGNYDYEFSIPFPYQHIKHVFSLDYKNYAKVFLQLTVIYKSSQKYISSIEVPMVNTFQLYSGIILKYCSIYAEQTKLNYSLGAQINNPILREGEQLFYQIIVKNKQKITISSIQLYIKRYVHKSQKVDKALVFSHDLLQNSADTSPMIMIEGSLTLNDIGVQIPTIHFQNFQVIYKLKIKTKPQKNIVSIPIMLLPNVKDNFQLSYEDKQQPNQADIKQQQNIEEKAKD